MLRPLVGKRYVQVLPGILIGLLVGLFAPNIAVKRQPLADGFIKLIKMLLAPIIFATVAIGLVVVNVVRPGAGMNIDARTIADG